METFITVAVFPPESMSVEDVFGPSPLSSAVRSPTNPHSTIIQTSSNSSSQKADCKPNGPLRKPSATTSPNKRRIISADTSAKMSKPATPVKQDLRKLNGVSQLSSSRKGKSMVNPTPEYEASSEIRPPHPVYFSPIHRPSTNPLFPIDTRSHQAHWPDTSGQYLKVEVWGKMPIGMERTTQFNEIKRLLEDRNFNWKLLNEWNVDLNRLIPLPDDVQTNFSPQLYLLIGEVF